MTHTEYMININLGGSLWTTKRDDIRTHILAMKATIDMLDSYNMDYEIRFINPLRVDFIVEPKN